MSALAGRPLESVRSSLDESPLARGTLILVGCYLAATTVPLIRASLANGQWGPSILHVAMLAILTVALHPESPSAARYWTPLALGPLLYIELRWIIEAVGRAHSDTLVRGWSDSAFGYILRAAPSDSLLVSEVLHLCYLSYYALVYVPPALLWLRGRRDDFASTVLALMCVYGVCFAVFIIFPVDGPRFLYGPALAPEGPFRMLAIRILDAGSSRGTAFPSAHVAASIVATICALRFQPAVGRVAAALTVGLAFGAVYGGYHYPIDVVAGIVVVIPSLLLARVVTRLSAAEPAAPR